jgi:hypothetical protein
VSGAIHDLGYKRYVGTRRPPSTRWRVIARHQIATAWKGWWRFKLALAIAVVVTVVAAMFIYVASSKTVTGMLGNHKLTFADWALPVAVNWCCRAAFILSLTVSASVIAGDMQSGAFTFYFARSTRPLDYLIGKLAGIGALMGVLVYVFPVIVAGLRLGLMDSTDELLHHLVMIPKMMAIGALATVAYTAIPLGFSAMVSNRRYALGLWAAYYLIFGTMALGVGIASHSPIAAIDIPQSIIALTNALFDINLGSRIEISTTAALVSLLGQSAAAIMVVWWQLANAQKAGVGGAT